MTDIVIRWSGPSDATIASTYKIECTLNNVDWTTLAAAQAATAPYQSVTGVLAESVDYGATSIVLDDGSAFATSGYLWLDDALVQWTGKSTNTLTGCSWRSGYGTYLADSVVCVAHESYEHTGVTITANVVLYRITHQDGDGNVSAPAYLWYYHPPVPASNRHCVVIASIATDLGVEARSGLGVQAYLKTDKEFSDYSGAHLDKAQSANKTQTTNAFGLAFFHCWKNAVRSAIGADDSPYIFVLDSGNADKLTVETDVIPNRDWVLLSQIASRTV